MGFTRWRSVSPDFSWFSILSHSKEMFVYMSRPARWKNSFFYLLQFLMENVIILKNLHKNLENSLTMLTCRTSTRYPSFLNGKNTHLLKEKWTSYSHCYISAGKCPAAIVVLIITTLFHLLQQLHIIDHSLESPSSMCIVCQIILTVTVLLFSLWFLLHYFTLQYLCRSAYSCS